jgi:hypothetical protein
VQLETSPPLRSNGTFALASESTLLAAPAVVAPVRAVCVPSTFTWAVSVALAPSVRSGEPRRGGGALVPGGKPWTSMLSPLADAER